MNNKDSPEEIFTAVGPVKVGATVKQMWVFMEILPREIIDVMRKAGQDVPHAGGLEKDARGFESLDHAIVYAQRVCASIFRKVKPEDLLFVFGQTLQALDDAEIEAPSDPIFLDALEKATGQVGGLQGDCNNQGESKYGAILLCKIEDTNELEEWFSSKKKHGGHGTQSYQVTWGELQEFKKCFGHVSPHKGPR